MGFGFLAASSCSGASSSHLQRGKNIGGNPKLALQNSTPHLALKRTSEIEKWKSIARLWQSFCRSIGFAASPLTEQLPESLLPVGGPVRVFWKRIAPQFVLSCAYHSRLVLGASRGRDQAVRRQDIQRAFASPMLINEALSRDQTHRLFPLMLASKSLLAHCRLYRKFDASCVVFDVKILRNLIDSDHPKRIVH